MRRALTSLLVTCCYVFGPSCFGQDIQVSDPEMELRDSKLHITYDILNSKLSDIFTVELRVTDDQGRFIRAFSLKGDVGENVPGGTDKRIIWDLEADQVEMTKIHVKIHVKAVPPPPVAEPAVADRQEPVTPVKEVAREGSGRAVLILQSVAFPGLGLTKITNKPHWIKGIAGYGCIAGSVILNRRAISTYDEISGLTDYGEKNNLLEQSKTQDNASELLAYAAIGIWVTDLVWTFVGTSGNGFSVRSSFDPYSNIPLFGITYRF